MIRASILFTAYTLPSTVQWQYPLDEQGGPEAKGSV